ncbi:hypothetical protein AB0H00_30095 [Nocardia sp. NPDC023852]|uniref:hypothetical protein n=1 Tax=Nocardia sp. NPDC023852 TaxID=3154697 RepID=UPI0033C58530
MPNVTEPLRANNSIAGLMDRILTIGGGCASAVLIASTQHPAIGACVMATCVGTQIPKAVIDLIRTQA